MMMTMIIIIIITAGITLGLPTMMQRNTGYKNWAGMKAGRRQKFVLVARCLMSLNVEVSRCDHRASPIETTVPAQ